MSTKKNMAKKAQNENVNTVANPTTAAVNPEQEKAKLEAARLAAEAKEAAKAAKEAAKAAKAAAEKAKAFSSRPVRKCYFIAYYEDNEEAFVGKGDVHYCVEKAAIDEVAKQREYGEDPRTVCIYKVHKSDETIERQLISKVYLDPTTSQIVID